MADGTGESLLAEEYWLATTGAQLLPAPTPQVRVGLAMAAIRDLDLSGDVVWDGRGPETVLHIGSSAEAPDPLRGWLDLLGDYAGVDGYIPARFCLDPLLDDVWEEVGEHLVRARIATCFRNRFSDDLYGVADVPGVRAWREDVESLLMAGQDLARQPLDVLLVAHTSHTVGEVLRGSGIEVPATLANRVGAAVRRDAETAHRYRETVTYRDSAGWAYGPAALAGVRPQG